MSTTTSLKYTTARALSAISLLQICLIAGGLALLAALIPVFGDTTAALAGNGTEVASAADAAPENEADLLEAAPSASGVPAKVALTPRMRAALGYVARRYRVSSEALGPIFQAVQSTGTELSLDPLLIVAVIGIESGFNPLSQSVMGAQGLMQIIPRFHRDKLPEGAGQAPLLDPVTNVRVGAQALEESIRRNGGLMEGLQQFAGATKDEDQSYATRVLAEKQRLEQAARRTGQG
ncbi:MAG TPA: lytic transglycosylase domain-containing protein [Azospira sp.]|nr:lytic transglycosylase domain-containing protein [Azospira sp.]